MVYKSAFAKELEDLGYNLRLEKHGFELVHAITDCIFISRENGAAISQAEIDALCSEILLETKVEMSTDGIYSWALFLPSREASG